MKPTHNPTSLCSLLAVVLLMMASHSLAAQPFNTLVHVDGLVCDFCARSIEKVFGRIDGVQDILVDLENGEVHLDLQSHNVIGDERITKLMLDAGFDVRGIDRSEI